MSGLTNIETKPFNQKEFFKKHKAGREHLPLREKRCGDCPSTDMYYEISKGLSEQETDLQVDCASSWFCHCTPNKSCRGVADYLSVKGSVDIKNNKIVPKE